MAELKNQKHEKWAQEFLLDLSLTQATIRAGYSEKTAGQQGWRLFKNVKIRERVEELKLLRAERTQITQDYVLNGIHDTTERCRQCRPVLDAKGQQVFVKTPEGDIAAAFVFDSKSTLKGFELMGKHVGMFRGDSGDADAPAPIKVEINVVDGRKE